MEFVQDGAVLVNRDWGLVQDRPPGLDTVEEFRVETNNSSAKMNRPATVIITTKSGTNQFHGAAVRNGAEQRRGGGAPPAGLLRQAAAPDPQRVRGIGGRAGRSSEALQRPNRTFFFFA